MTETEQVELQPDVREVLQVEEEPDMAPIVGVAVQGPVRAQILPRKSGGTRTVTINATGVVQVLHADPRRAVAYLVAHAQDFLVAYSRAAAQDDSTMARIPVNTLLEVGASVDVWVKSQTSNTTLSVIQERWADGE